MKICYFFLKSKKDLGGRKILFTLWAFSKSQRVEEYKGQTHKIMTNYHMRFPIDLNSMLIWNFFSDFFPSYVFVTKNIRAQSLPNHKHFEV